MPESPKLSFIEASRAREAFVRAWSKKWFNPLSWFRPRVGTALSVLSSGMVKTWRVTIMIHDERHEQAVAKVARKYLPGVPTEIKLVGNPVAAGGTKTPLV